MEVERGERKGGKCRKKKESVEGVERKRKGEEV